MAKKNGEGTVIAEDDLWVVAQLDDNQYMVCDADTYYKGCGYDSENIGDFDFLKHRMWELSEAGLALWYDSNHQEPKDEKTAQIGLNNFCSLRVLENELRLALDDYADDYARRLAEKDSIDDAGLKEKFHTKVKVTK